MKISLPGMFLRITVFTLLLQAMASHAGLHLSVMDNWRTLEDDMFSINYKKQDKALAEQTLAIARQVLPQIEQFLQWQVSTRIYINVIDSQDDPNGWAMVVPYNHITVYTTPPTIFSEMNDYRRWMRMLVTHELTHIVHIDMAQGTPLALRKVFGRFPLLFPNQLQPRLFTEGLATYVETDWQRGAGRGQSPYFNMMMRTEVESGLLSLGEAQQAREEWPLNQAYLYGVFFYQFLESKYGKDSIPAYVGEYSADLIPFMLSEPSRRVANKTIKALWDEYLAWLESRFRPEIARLEAQGITAGTQLTHNGFYTSRPLLLEKGDMVYVGISPQSATTMRLRSASGAEQALGKVKADARLVGIADGYVYFLQSSPCKDNLLFDELYRVSLARAGTPGSTRLNLAEKISSCKRYTHAELSIDKKTLALVRSRTGTQQLVLMPLSTRKQQILWQGNVDQYIARPVWIDSENLLVSRKEPDAGWQLYRFNIPARQWQHVPVDLPDGNRQMPFYSVQENAVYFTSDHSGVYDIYRSKPDGSDVVRITRSLGGSTDAVVANGQLYYTGYSASGWDIYSMKPDVLPGDNIVAGANGVSGNNAVADSSILTAEPDNSKGMIINWNNDDKLAANEHASDHPYSAFPALWPTSWFIGSQSTGDAMELGVQVSGNDPLYLHTYLLGMAYDINLQKTSALLEYVFDTHLFFGYRHAYEITGNNEPVLSPEFAINSYITRDDWQAAVQHTWPFDYVNITPFIAINHTGEALTDWLGTSGYLELERKITTSGVGFIYDSTEYYLQGISASNGRTIKITLESDRVQTAFAKNSNYGYSDLGGNVTAFDWREYIDLSNRHVMALQYFRGEGGNDTDPFRLRSSQGMTAFTQQYVHQRDIRLRGYPDSLHELTDSNAEFYSVEWRFPLWDIYKGIAGWPLGAHSVHGALFYDAGAVWGTLQNAVKYGNRHIYDSAGIEFKTDVDLAYSSLPLQAGVGYAQPLRETEQGKSAELYISLSALF